MNDEANILQAEKNKEDMVLTMQGHKKAKAKQWYRSRRF